MVCKRLKSYVVACRTLLPSRTSATYVGGHLSLGLVSPNILTMGRLETTPESDSQPEDSRSRSEILILNEANKKANHLGKIYPLFLDAIKKLPENIRRDNDKVFDKWRTLLVSVDHYDLWGEKMKHALHLQLQNAPGDDGISQF